MYNKDMWRNRKVLVTGHTGFKGSWLCIWLNELGADVSGLSFVEPVSSPDMFTSLNLNQIVNDQRGDIVDSNVCSNTLKNIEPEILFHMAAQPLVMESYSDPLTTYKTNVIGTANILNAARSCKSLRAIILVTSEKCYKNIEKDSAYVETDPLGGRDPYSSSKSCAELVASSYYQSFLTRSRLKEGF